MIIFDLSCQHEHRFEGWFQSPQDFDSQLERGLIACPQCGSLFIRRVPSAVHLARPQKPSQMPVPADTPARESPAIDSHVGALGMYRQLSEALLADCEDVGSEFAEEARRIHYLQARERSIRGEASADEYEALRDEGIAVLRLPRLKPGDLH